MKRCLLLAVALRPGLCTSHDPGWRQFGDLVYAVHCHVRRFFGDTGCDSSQDDGLKDSEELVASDFLGTAQTGFGGVELPEDLPVLDSLCGLDLPEKVVVDCSCCADHLVGAPADKAALLFGGGPGLSPAFLTEGSTGRSSTTGRVRSWSLGGRLPSVWCDRGQLVCRCEDLDKSWHEEERACRTGGNCTAPAVLPEAASGAPAVEQTEDVAAASNSQLMCDAGESSRISIGRAQCGDFNVSQCDRLYALGASANWHFCATEARAVRVCGARAISSEAASRASEGIRSWALQNLFNPGTGWALEIRGDGTSRVVASEAPDPALFEELVRRRLPPAAAARRESVDEDSD